ncbi:efflux RND transporter periplasmic adaptor subunit [Fluviicola taffensis]|uniref:Efflux transporter, RND family, MFP subunit n=1 Tax=Fluviicola taffensis (strain DSM 16823 / NCIMB 13979 / RW262) TaxID=755732 RepID=F2IH20_FLUTR|nr:efflux RND transporter periplasmic adaptor subunit [Fluviicola taffensis]AEA45834.1 efflux transporter, RND family, MFP subunit [Fluviicola taffensis DSM 16823]
MNYSGVFLFGVLLLLASCADQKANKQVTETYPVTSPIHIDTNTFIEYVADISAVRNIEIRAKAAGYLEKVHVDEGSYVTQGQLLFSINNREYSEALAKDRALLKMARAEAKNAELELTNTKMLLDKNVISHIEYEFAKNKLQIAKAKVEEMLAEEAHGIQMLSYAEIRAPFNGTISRLPHKIGSLIEDGTLLTDLSQNDEIFAYFNVSEKEYLDFMSKIARGNELDRQVQLVMANGELHKSDGLIEMVNGQIDPQTGNLAIRARFSNKGKILKHGASGKIRMQQEFRQALIIPQKATFEIQDKVFVYLLDRQGHVKTRRVEIKARIPHFYIISKGLHKNDVIIYEGIQSVSDGMKVKLEKIPLKRIIRELSTVN